MTWLSLPPGGLKPKNSNILGISKNPKSLCDLAMHYKILQGLKGTHFLVDLLLGMDWSECALQEEGRCLVSTQDALGREHKVPHPMQETQCLPRDDTSCKSVPYLA